MAERDNLYGNGMSYPFAIDPTTGGTQEAAAVDSVKSSLVRLFDTAPGEDFMNPQYGCALKYLLFEADTPVLKALAETTIRKAVNQWEPRIADVLSVEVTTDDVNEHLLVIRVYFRLIESQTINNLVYPFVRAGA